MLKWSSRNHTSSLLLFIFHQNRAPSYLLHGLFNIIEDSIRCAYPNSQLTLVAED
ncbi:hypothetical protein M378DRAFT_206667 [Amanita muscaria Koide BX008]|uniref:Uncharacterized protein n=1 Tax=Amanita muscaria (strain Koide BX008) TaxID=946122 RepID=A0A0C2XPU7_AMAMK|nr:hypothetical protein M378DRAFT_206667 [Amanita muscaria Koide BX008]